MQRFLSLALAAVGILLSSQQQASAWINFKFSAGVNWQFQSGGNSLLWGLFRDGQPPGPHGYCGGSHDGQQYYGHAQGGQANYHGYAAPQDPYYGYAPPVAPTQQAAPTAAVQATPTSYQGPSHYQPIPAWNQQTNPSSGYSNIYQQFYYYQPGTSAGPQLQQYRYGFSFGW